MWIVEATGEFGDWFGNQNQIAKEEIVTVIELLRSKGPALGRPYADRLKGSRFANMKELRVNARRLAIRIAFAFDPNRKAILLVAGDKRGVNQSRFCRQLIALADALYARHLSKR